MTRKGWLFHALIKLHSCCLTWQISMIHSQELKLMQREMFFFFQSWDSSNQIIVINIIVLLAAFPVFSCLVYSALRFIPVLPRLLSLVPIYELQNNKTWHKLTTKIRAMVQNILGFAFVCVNLNYFEWTVKISLLNHFKVFERDFANSSRKNTVSKRTRWFAKVCMKK